MSRSVPTDDAGADEDWVVLSTQEIPPPPDNRPVSSPDNRTSSSPTSDDYLNFQLRTRFGTFSFVVRPKTNSETKQIAGTADENEDKIINAQDQSPLFRLPVELRLEIYERILRLPTGAKIIPHSPRERARNNLAILATCRRILSEAGGIFYAINRFSLPHPAEFLTSLGPERRAAITKFGLPVVSGAAMLLGLKQLHVLPNLTSLYVRRGVSLKFTDVKGWAVMAPQLVGELRGMGRLREVRIFTPEAGELTDVEGERKEKLQGIDARLCAAVGGAGS